MSARSRETERTPAALRSSYSPGTPPEAGLLIPVNAGIQSVSSARGFQAGRFERIDATTARRGYYRTSLRHARRWHAACIGAWHSAVRPDIPLISSCRQRVRKKKAYPSRGGGAKPRVSFTGDSRATYLKTRGLPDGCRGGQLFASISRSSFSLQSSCPGPARRATEAAA